jgi:hypothetical protein
VDWLQQLQQGLEPPPEAASNGNGAGPAAAAAAAAAVDGDDDDAGNDDEESAIMRQVLEEMERLMSSQGLLQQAMLGGDAGAAARQQQGPGQQDAWKQQLKKYEVGGQAPPAPGGRAGPSWRAPPPPGPLAPWPGASRRGHGVAGAACSNSILDTTRAALPPPFPFCCPNADLSPPPPPRQTPLRLQVDEGKLRALLADDGDAELDALLASGSDSNDDDLQGFPELQGDEEDDLRVLMQDPAELARILDQVRGLQGLGGAWGAGGGS